MLRDLPHEMAAPSDEELGLLDILLVLAENIKLLLVVPLVVGLLSLGVASIWPPSYESTSVVMAERTNNSFTVDVVSRLVTSASVLDPVAREFGFLQNRTPEEARRHLLENVKTSVGRGDRLLTLVTAARGPESAQRLNQAVLDQLFLQTRPKGADLARLQDRLNQEKSSLAAAVKLEAELAKALFSKGQTESAGRAYVNLLLANSKKAEDIQALEMQIGGLTVDAIIQPPTSPEKPTSPNKWLIVVLAALASGVALLVFVAIRSSLMRSTQNAAAADKLLRIRRALHVRRRGA